MEMTATQIDVGPRTLGPHDLGGEVGHGPVPVEEGQSFHDDWEPHVLALVFGGALNGLFGFGDFRAAMENLHPLAYRSLAYYDRLLYSVETNLVASGVLTPRELERGMREIAKDPTAPLPQGTNDQLADSFRVILAEGIADLKAQHDPARPPRFAEGDHVGALVIGGEDYVSAHARHPSYVQGKNGVIESVYGIFPTFAPYDLPSGDTLENVYAVRFEGSHLWPDAEPRTSVLIDLSESYLQPAVEGAES